MTREEAKGNLIHAIRWNDMPKKEALYTVVKALEQEPCEDAISRQAVDTLVDELARGISDERCCISRGRSTATIMRDICHLPSVTPQPKTGHWIKKEDDTCWWYVCSECEQEPLKNRWNNDDVLSTFCPNCGCRMVEPQESEVQDADRN